MKKISFRVRNFDKEQFLTFQLDDDATLDEDVLNFLEDEEPKGIVPIIYEEEEDFDAFTYNITDKIHLSEMSDQEVDAEMVLKVMRSLALALVDMQEYRVPLSYLVLNRTYIYVDADYQIEFICIPLEDMQEEVDVNSFLRNFLASLRFDSSENGDYVARLFTYINNTAIFNLRNFVTLIENLMESMNVEIPEDNSAEIYVDYQEVEEEESVNPQEQEETDEILEEESAPVEESVEEGAPAEESVEEEASAEESIEEEAHTEEDDSDYENDNFEPEKWRADYEEEMKMEEILDDDDDTEDLINEEKAAEEPNSDDLMERIFGNKEAESREDLTEESNATSYENDTPKKEDKTQDRVENKSVNSAKVEADPVKEVTMRINEDKKVKEKNGSKKIKEKAASGVLLQDELDDYLAEKELEEQNNKHHEETNIRFKKDIKISRADLVKNGEAQKEAQKEVEEEKKEEKKSSKIAEQPKETRKEEEKQTENNPKVDEPATAELQKINPYLVRVNTQDRVMITKANFKIGKSSVGVDYTVKGNNAISRVHAIIVKKDNQYFIKDNKSTNHIFVDGKEVAEGKMEALQNGSKIVLGDEEFEFKF